MLNVAHRVSAQVGAKHEPVWKVRQTLRSSSRGSVNANTTVSTYTAKRVISCISLLRNATKATTSVTLVCGFSDGTISSWERNNNEDNQWAETVLVRADDSECWDGRAITDIGGIHEGDCGRNVCVVTCSSGGAFQFHASVADTPEGNATLKRTQLIPTTANAVRFNRLASDENATLLLIGTAAPRHNKIHVFVLYDEVAKDDQKSRQPSTHYCGALSGHEDWITCFDWRSLGSVDHLASGSHDARIRLWKFTTTTSTALVQDDTMPALDDDAAGDEDDEDEDDDDEEEIEEGESRLEVIVPSKSQTSVTLEALLIGHEERVTAVAWHPNPQPIYGEDLILISSSMDRSIFIWSELSGIWTPISRVGSAGGILGGSIGSSLLGFLNVQLEPNDGQWMMGHGYGGALHFFSCESASVCVTETPSPERTVEERAALSPWKAQPCLTGHFDNVTDLCWESTTGEYLLTAGADQTCRVWAPLPVSNPSKDEYFEEREVWVEIARPQVHGYDLSAITSLSTPDHRHLLVSGADEKELRVFDATRTFDQLLQRVNPRVQLAAAESISQRVDRAYIPSLGLSNKATASEGAEQDTGGVSESSTQLPLERDLGALSLWPEIQKLYGHNTELTRLTSTTTAKSGMGISKDTAQKDVLVASSAKARDLDAACIRLWNVSESRCAQVLKGGHRSTVTAMSFSPDTRFLVSSGKDRRLCVWERKQATLSDEESSITWGAFELSCAVDVAHKRIVWGAHFCPFDSTVFATCSRDGSVKIWKLSERVDEEETKTSLEETQMFVPSSMASNGKPEAVTSVSFAPKAMQKGANTALLAVGLENGVIELWLVQLHSPPCDSPTLALLFPPAQCHIAAVTKLAWKPNRPTDDKMVLASCSMDHGCRIFEVLI